MQKLYGEFKGRGLEVVAITWPDPRDTAMQYFHKSGYTFKAGRLSPPFYKESRFSVHNERVSPMTTFLIDHNGRIAFRDYDSDSDYDELRAALVKLGF